MGSRSPLFVLPGANQDIYLVLEDFGARLGRAWRETDEQATSRETLIDDLMHGQYNHPAELRRRLVEYDEVPAAVQAFVETVSQA